VFEGRAQAPRSLGILMRLVRGGTLLLALGVSALAQAGPKPSSCRTSFGFTYTDKLGNKYESAQGAELREIQKRLAKRQHGSVCIVDEGVPGYIFSLQAYAKTRMAGGTQYTYTEYVLEIHRGSAPFELVHTLSRASRLGVRNSESSSPIIDLVEDAAAWLDQYPQG